ncbi:hypothetical protein D3C87_1746140 [compost metagenome]
MTISAPSEIGFCKHGEAKVLSQTNINPSDFASPAIVVMSVILSNGLEGVSVQIITVFFLMCRLISSVSVRSIKSASMLPAKTVSNNFLSPQYMSSGAMM